MKRNALILWAGASVLLISSRPVAAQQLEPGAYSVSPVGVNLILVTNSIAGGDLTFDPSLPVEDAEATVDTTIFGYVRSMSVLGRSANIGVGLPLVAGKVQGFYIGEFTRVERFGFRDPQVRFAINLHGAPAMNLQEFSRYRQKLNVGVSFVVAPPLGQYDSSKLINLGSNRWSFKPELGISRAVGRWTLELFAGAWFFTDNTNFFGGKTRHQDPIGATQFHVLYTFKPRMWISFNGNFYTGGRTSVDDTFNQDLQRNSRIGTTFAFPLNRRHSLKLAYSRGAFTTIGADFDAFAVAYQYLWGAGL